MTVSEYPPAPTTGEELIARWAQRDAEYAKMRTPLSPEVAEATRQARMREANDLPNVGERARLWGRASTWEPPVHAEFGNLKDWLRD